MGKTYPLRLVFDRLSIHDSMLELLDYCFVDGVTLGSLCQHAFASYDQVCLRNLQQYMHSSSILQACCSLATCPLVSCIFSEDLTFPTSVQAAHQRSSHAQN